MDQSSESDSIWTGSLSDKNARYFSHDQASAAGLINSSDTGGAYIGVDHTNIYPGTGRPSVRIETAKSWTHGLFIGDFSHAPGGICGTWPACQLCPGCHDYQPTNDSPVWTIGPNWPYTGEIDILEGVNLLTANAMSLHT